METTICLLFHGEKFLISKSAAKKSILLETNLQFIEEFEEDENKKEINLVYPKEYRETLIQTIEWMENGRDMLQDIEIEIDKLNHPNSLRSRYSLANYLDIPELSNIYRIYLNHLMNDPSVSFEDLIVKKLKGNPVFKDYRKVYMEEQSTCFHPNVLKDFE